MVSNKKYKNDYNEFTNFVKQKGTQWRAETDEGGMSFKARRFGTAIPVPDFLRGYQDC